ncbi:hypothetical protein IQ266_16100 [filamentous cyanobacterium LEGE 11480]|uniref:Uncharacterized protein n=1 Tax=Romeriopsis navalis LEGE 11480 TaxID=2777977 RepID=A0A928VP98_9CYAN|nr:hypothetical protein [Romeriopsis navalis LEGE 11480]
MDAVVLGREFQDELVVVAVVEEKSGVKQTIEISQSLVADQVSITPMQERLASLKAGMISGMTVLAVWAAITGAGHMLLGFDVGQWYLAAGIVAFSGLLFGVTYRYVIRHDRNPHLKSGAVGAFALVRGLAQVEPLLLDGLTHWRLVLLLLGQNLVMFTVARWVIDQGSDRGWLNRFPMALNLTTEKTGVSN